MHCRICNFDIPDNQLKFDAKGKTEPCKECLDSIADLSYCNSSLEDDEKEVEDIVFIETNIEDIIGSEVFPQERDDTEE